MCVRVNICVYDVYVCLCGHEVGDYMFEGDYVYLFVYSSFSFLYKEFYR